MINLRNREVCYLTEEQHRRTMCFLELFLNCSSMKGRHVCTSWLLSSWVRLSARGTGAGSPRGVPPMTFVLTELNVTLLGLEFRSQPLTLLANNKVKLPGAQLVVWGFSDGVGLHWAVAPFWIQECVYLCICFLWRRQWHPTPVLLPGKSHGGRSLVGCPPWGR